MYMIQKIAVIVYVYSRGQDIRTSICNTMNNDCRSLANYEISKTRRRCQFSSDEGLLTQNAAQLSKVILAKPNRHQT